MDNNMNIDLRKKQITELVIKYYEESDFLKDKSLEKFIDKTLEKFLNSDLTIEQIEQRIIDAIEKKKQQLGKHDDSINEGNYELDNTKMAINVEEADNDFNSDLDGMLDNVDNTPEIKKVIIIIILMKVDMPILLGCQLCHLLHSLLL